jgi:hypothetical protein
VVVNILFDGENISFDAGLVMYINSTSIPPIMIMNRMFENENLLYIVPLMMHTVVVCMCSINPMLTAVGLTPGGSTNLQYTEQHKETEYPEQNTHNNKNT